MSDLDGYEEFSRASGANNVEDGSRGVATANFIGVRKASSFAGLFFDHPVFGTRRSPTDRVRAGCEACFFVTAVVSEERAAEGSPRSCHSPEAWGGRFSAELTCMYDATDAGVSAKCRRLVANARHRLAGDIVRGEGVLSQYLNTPSCGGAVPFHKRYWGSNYGRLLRTKRRWDPDAVFNHCHSVGSTDEDCCH